jgi:hypothetical protein
MGQLRELIAFDRKYALVSPMPEEHFLAIWEWLGEFTEQMVNDYTPRTSEDVVAKLTLDVASGGKSYMILSDDSRPIGAVWGEVMGDEVYMTHLVFARYSLSTPEKLALARAAVRQFFADGARKLCWAMYVDNRAFRIFLRRMGASVEGTFRKATRRNGQLVDVIMMATFPEDMG